MGENDPDIDEEAEEAEEAFVVRQPIFDRDKTVWGYELVTNYEEVPTEKGKGESLSDLVARSQKSMSVLNEELKSDKKLLLNITQERYLNNDDFPKDWDHCVFGVSPKTAISEHCSGFADSMHGGGGAMAIDNDMDLEAHDALVDKCDIVKVSLAGKTPPEIIKIRRQYKDFKGKLLATDVTSWEAYEGTRALGFKYFQGPFFSVPEIHDEAEISASSIAKLQLLRELSNPDSDMEELATIIASDVSLSYRILKYINSASFGLRNKIMSIQQAVSLLGLKELRHWTTVVVMTDLDSSPKGEELAYMALQRGRFLSNLAGTISDFKHSQNTMFMLGLFSKLDALLSYPMDKALEDIPLNKDIKDGLCGTLNEFRDWLRVLEAVEVGNWDIANDILGRYGACFTTAATQYMKAASWAAQQLPDMKK